MNLPCMELYISPPYRQKSKKHIWRFSAPTLIILQVHLHNTHRRSWPSDAHLPQHPGCDAPPSSSWWPPAPVGRTCPGRCSAAGLASGQFCRVCPCGCFWWDMKETFNMWSAVTRTSPGVSARRTDLAPSGRMIFTVRESMTWSSYTWSTSLIFRAYWSPRPHSATSVTTALYSSSFFWCFS